MSLEGRLRDLGLPEVCQLLGSSRKSGTLQVRAPLQAHAAELRFVQGAIADAVSWPLEPSSGAGAFQRAIPELTDVRSVEAVVLDVLTWREGEFEFVAENGDARSTSPIRLAVDSLLVEAAHRSEVWERVKDRVPGAHVVPAFVDIDPQQLPLLRLVPQEWELLTRVDGRRDLAALASVLGRPLLDVAEIAHALIGAGVLALRVMPVPPRRHPTPPARPVVETWIPSHAELRSADDPDDDAVFDPVAAGVIDRDGMPSRQTPAQGPAAVGRGSEPAPDGASGPFDVIAATARVLQTASNLEISIDEAVASVLPQQSLSQRDAPRPALDMDAASLCEHGDDAARSGDLAAALTWWSAALRMDAAAVDADRVREAIALAARLHALLHPADRR